MEPTTSKVSMNDHRRRRCGARRGGPARSAGSIAAKLSPPKAVQVGDDTPTRGFRNRATPLREQLSSLVERRDRKCDDRRAE